MWVEVIGSSPVSRALAWILGAATHGVVAMLREFDAVTWKVVPRQPGINTSASII